MRFTPFLQCITLSFVDLMEFRQKKVEAVSHNTISTLIFIITFLTRLSVFINKLSCKFPTHSLLSRIHKALINTLLFHQLIVCSLLYNSSLIYHNNLIRVSDIFNLCAILRNLSIKLFNRFIKVLLFLETNQ